MSLKWGKRSNVKLPYLIAQVFHTYGLKWSKDEIVWYIDGQVIRTRENTHWHQLLTLNLDSETMPDWFGLPDPETLPSTYSIDYVRSWQDARETDSQVELSDIGVPSP